MRKTLPQFTLTGSVQLSLLRGEPDKVVNGRPVKGETEDLEIKANVQPLSFREVMQLPESERTKDWIKIYSPEMIRTLKEGEHQADVVLWQDEQWRVMKCHSYKMSILDHYVAHATKITKGSL